MNESTTANCCPFCGADTDRVIHLRSLEVMVRFFPSKQFPYTLNDVKDGDNLVEIPSCFKNKQFLNAWELKRGKKVRRKLYCEDL